MDYKQPEVIYEDEYIAVIGKPAGLIVNRADTAKDVETLQDWVDNKLKIKNSKLKITDETKDFLERSGIVHRLDKETSGLLIIARDYISFLDLQKQFKQGRVEKTYVALVHGKITLPEGEINVPIGRLPWDRRKFGVIPAGRESQTFYKVLEYKKIKYDKKEEDLTLVELYPKTGRTHQIRVHLRYLGFPVVGDELYAGRKNFKNDRKLLNRHFLHAEKIKFYHPQSEEILEFESPLPQELVDFLSPLT
ncbi:MAG: hypothetical protein A2905_02450 [Candidatus Levybacteria bacterium RIFCSPLOWO2_01_FULL_36_10]|nr:MAG: hypothetical protein A2905_02450 [Candidatus Levybacteria bacterium RIFCSPLOWO2_01_FULL_36_10]